MPIQSLTHLFTPYPSQLQVPNNSISHFYPPQDNYVPHPNGTRSPKSLVDLCINSLCRSLPNFDELPPGLPQELVDRIVSSLTSHGALNSTTLRCLNKCELSVLNLASCRGVSDEWFSPQPRSNNLSMRSLSPTRKRGEQRPRSASVPYGNPSTPHPLSSIHHAFSAPTPDFMDVDDEYQELDSSPQESMEELSSSSSSASFVSAFSSPCSVPSASSPRESVEIAEDHMMYSPLLPSVLPPPDFFSMKQKPMWQSPNNNGVCMPLYSSLGRQPPPLLPYASSLHTQDSLEYSDVPEASEHENHHSSLTVLDLRGSRITDRGLLRLSHPSPLSSLEIVKLDNCHGITGRGLIAFARSSNLHTLTLANCRRITDEAVVNVSHLGRSLMTVNLGGCRCLTDRSLEALGGLLELRKLDLSQVSDTLVRAPLCF